MTPNYLTRLFSGMASQISSGNGTETRKKTEPHWQKGPGAPEEELESLLVSIKERVYTLRESVHEQSVEIARDIDSIEQIVTDIDEQYGKNDEI